MFGTASPSVFDARLTIRPRGVLTHRSHDGLRHQELGVDVDSLDAFPFGEVQLEDVLGGENPGIIDEDVDASGETEHVGGNGGDLLRIGKVRLQRKGLLPDLLHRRDRVVRRVQINRDDVGTSACELAGDGMTETSSRAGYDCDTACMGVHRVTPV